MARSDFNYIYKLRVRWSEVDMQKVVFFGNYVNYFDCAMTEYMREIRYAYPQGLIDGGSDFHVVKTGIEYQGSFRFDDRMEICTRVERLGRSSVTFAFEAYREGEDEMLVSGQIIYVNVALEERKSVPLPEEMTRRMREREVGRLEAG